MLIFMDLSEIYGEMGWALKIIKENKFLNCTLLPIALFTVNGVLEL